LEPGLWISVGSASKSSKVLQDHPEWAVRDEQGELVNLHGPGSNRDQWTMCFGTEWMGYIKNKILELVRELGLSYVKLDLSVVTSAYRTEINKSGCYAKDHPYHKDHEESLIVIYERLFRLFDELQPLHLLGAQERFWLNAGALLHDIGWIEGQKGHHKTALRTILHNNFRFA
jgi:alpha-galactosidase